MRDVGVGVYWCRLYNKKKEKKKKKKKKNE
jgi:hypothetical protein